MPYFCHALSNFIPEFRLAWQKHDIWTGPQIQGFFYSKTECYTNCDVCPTYMYFVTSLWKQIEKKNWKNTCPVSGLENSAIIHGLLTNKIEIAIHTLRTVFKAAAQNHLQDNIDTSKMDTLNYLYFNFMGKCLWVPFHHFLNSCSEINTFVMKSETKENIKSYCLTITINNK